jgi:RNA polymerase sigma-70 factor (ECF subfamily)
MMAAMQPGGTREDRARPSLGALLYTAAGESEQDYLALLQRIAARDASALQALYLRAHPIVFSLSLRITADQAAAEAVTVDVFDDVWRQAKRYDPACGSVLAWIMNRARSRAIDRVGMERQR